MPDIDYWLSRKYAGIDAQNNADMIRANASAGLQRAQTAVLPDTTAADIAFQRAQTQHIGVETNLLPAESAARIRAANAGATRDTASAGLIGAQTTEQVADTRALDSILKSNSLANGAIRRLYSSSLPDISLDAVDQRNRAIRGYAKGTARVPGKGSPKVDSVKAKLAPGEAVLNKPAADGLGRGLIAALNKMGSQKLGLV